MAVVLNADFFFVYLWSQDRLQKERQVLGNLKNQILPNETFIDWPKSQWNNAEMFYWRLAVNEEGDYSKEKDSKQREMEP